MLPPWRGALLHGGSCDPPLVVTKDPTSQAPRAPSILRLERHNASMAASSTFATPLTKAEIIDIHAKLEELRLVMASRSAGGREASGRYKRHDTARKVFIDTVAMPGLRLGKRIPAADWRRLFLPGDDEISGPDKADMDAWYKLHKKDPRSTSTASYQLDEGKQLTLMQWVASNSAAYARPQPAPSGAPPAYRLTYRDSKVSALLISHARVCRAARINHHGVHSSRVRMQGLCRMHARSIGRGWHAKAARADRPHPGRADADLHCVRGVPVALPGATPALSCPDRP